MHVAMMLLMLIPSADGDGDHKRFIRLNRQWQAIHATTAPEKTPANAFFVIDPRESAVWIEREGRIDASEVEQLPAGLEWSAYHITQQGVREISFPVRLARPRLQGEANRDGETVWVIGFGKDCGWQFSITPDPKGHTFHVGSGSSVSSLTVQRPVLKDEPAADSYDDSILVPDSPHPRKWADTIRNKHFSINVERFNAAP